MTNRTEQGEAMTAIILEVFRLNGALLEAGNRITKPYGLTSARWQVMGAIDLVDQSLTVAQVARRMGLTRQGVQRIVNDLVILEMVTPETNIDHKRAPLFSISNKGAKAMAKINQVQAEWVNQLSKGTSSKQLAETLKLLQTVRERIE